MEMNEEAKLALQIIETTGSNLFLTGKAGTGKTTFLRELKRSTSKRNVVLAPTGLSPPMCLTRRCCRAAVLSLASRR